MMENRNTLRRQNQTLKMYLVRGSEKAIYYYSCFYWLNWPVLWIRMRDTL